MGALSTQAAKRAGRPWPECAADCAPPMEWASAIGFSPGFQHGRHDPVHQRVQVFVIFGEVARQSSCGGRRPARGSEPPWPRQSMVATAKPRPRSSSITSKYFSMNSVWPFSSTQTPRAATSGSGRKRAARKRGADGLDAEWARTAWRRGSCFVGIGQGSGALNPDFQAPQRVLKRVPPALSRCVRRPSAPDCPALPLSAAGGTNNASRRLFHAYTIIPLFSVPPSASTGCSNLLDTASEQGYPPYNIERSDENNYRVTVAVAGFAEKDLTVDVKDRVLTVTGKREDEAAKAVLPAPGHRRPRLRAQLPARRACRGQGRAPGKRPAPCRSGAHRAGREEAPPHRDQRRRAVSNSQTIEGAKAA